MKAHLLENEYHVKSFDIDTALRVEYNFEEYKRLIYETSVIVECFWSTLAKKEFMMRDLLELGVRIVDSYFEIKELYQTIIMHKLDFKEAVRIYVYFN